MNRKNRKFLLSNIDNKILIDNIIKDASYSDEEDKKFSDIIFDLLLNKLKNNIEIPELDD